jgi:hypothetical protein
MPYLTQCLDLLKRGTGEHVPKTLDILTAIFRTFPIRKAWGNAPAGKPAPAAAGTAVRADELLKMMDNEHKLVALLVQEMLRYKEVAEKSKQVFGAAG